MVTLSNQPILQIKNVQKQFGDVAVHKGVSFDLHKGECLVLLGGSGTGKSVLLRSIIGLEYIDGGEIIFKNDRIDNLTENQLYPYRLNISYAFQNGALFDSLTVFDNIAYPLFEHTKLGFDEISQKIQTMLKTVDLEGKENLMPSDLSGGMQKRVGMARAMILEPDIVLYDEPTAGLDPVNIQKILTLMKTLKSMGQTSIFVTHDIPSAMELCDRIVILNNGKIGFNGNKQEFLNSTDAVVNRFSKEVQVSSHETKR